MMLVLLILTHIDLVAVFSAVITVIMKMQIAGWFIAMVIG